MIRSPSLFDSRLRVLAGSCEKELLLIRVHNIKLIKSIELNSTFQDSEQMYANLGIKFLNNRTKLLKTCLLNLTPAHFARILHKLKTASKPIKSLKIQDSHIARPKDSWVAKLIGRQLQSLHSSNEILCYPCVSTAKRLEYICNIDCSKDRKTEPKTIYHLSKVLHSFRYLKHYTFEISQIDYSNHWKHALKNLKCKHSFLKLNYVEEYSEKFEFVEALQTSLFIRKDSTLLKQRPPILNKILIANITADVDSKSSHLLYYIKNLENLFQLEFSISSYTDFIYGFLRFPESLRRLKWIISSNEIRYYPFQDCEFNTWEDYEATLNRINNDPVFSLGFMEENPFFQLEYLELAGTPKKTETGFEILMLALLRQCLTLKGFKVILAGYADTLPLQVYILLYYISPAIQTLEVIAPLKVDIVPSLSELPNLEELILLSRYVFVQNEDGVKQLINILQISNLTEVCLNLCVISETHLIDLINVLTTQKVSKLEVYGVYIHSEDALRKLLEIKQKLPYLRYFHLKRLSIDIPIDIWNKYMENIKSISSLYSCAFEIVFK